MYTRAITSLVRRTALHAPSVLRAAVPVMPATGRVFTCHSALRLTHASATMASDAASAAPSAPVDDGEVRMVMYGDGFERTVSGRVGETLLNVAQLNDVDQLEGACEGCMCCSTCHLIFDESTYKSIGPVSDDEQDLIDRAAGVTDTSRLGCQVRVSKVLQGARIRIPSEFNNQML